MLILYGSRYSCDSGFAGNEAEAEHINIVSASQQTPTKGLQNSDGVNIHVKHLLFCTLSNLFVDDQSHLMHEVHHETSGGAVFLSSGEQGRLRDDISSGTDVDMPTCQNAEIDGDKDHATETVVESIQAPCDASDKDHSADLPATTLVTAESNKITTCDMEVVCAGNSESSGGGEVGTIGVQEAAAIADHEGPDLNYTSMHDQVLAGSGNEAPGGVVQGNPSHHHLSLYKWVGGY
jgi:hypothetical protein